MDLDLLSQLGISHSCYPNSILNTDNKLVTLVPLAANTAITLDYSTVIDEEIIIEKCNCGFNGCRKTIRNYLSLPVFIREKYEESGSVRPSCKDQFTI